MKPPSRSVWEVMESKGYSRREFLQFCSYAAMVAGLAGSDLPAIAQAFEKKPRPPVVNVKTVFVTAFAVSATRIGKAALAGAIFPALANVATEIAAGSTLANPAKAAVITIPGGPSHSFIAVEATRTAARRAVKTAAANGLNACPRSFTRPEL